MSEGTIQPRLEISDSDDIHEREAERVAKEVMRLSLPESASEIVDGAKGESTSRDGLIIDEEQNKLFESLTEGGRPLAPSVRSFFEPRFERDFGDVRVHTGSQADKAARSIGAEAFTHGTDIAFARGMYRPRTRQGKELLAHELTHVIQQDPNGNRVQRSIKLTSVDRENTVGGYKVEKGDTLSDIAKRARRDHPEFDGTYNDLWKFNANHMQGDGPGEIYPREVVYVPGRDQVSDDQIDTGSGSAPSSYDQEDRKWSDKKPLIWDELGTDSMLDIPALPEGPIRSLLRKAGEQPKTGPFDANTYLLYNFKIGSHRYDVKSGYSQFFRELWSSERKDPREGRGALSGDFVRLFITMGCTDPPGSWAVNRKLRDLRGIQVGNQINHMNEVGLFDEGNDPVDIRNHGALYATRVPKGEYLTSDFEKAENRAKNRSVLVFDAYWLVEPVSPGPPPIPPEREQELIDNTCKELRKAEDGNGSLDIQPKHAHGYREILCNFQNDEYWLQYWSAAEVEEMNEELHLSEDPPLKTITDYALDVEEDVRERLAYCKDQGPRCVIDEIDTVILSDMARSIDRVDQLTEPGGQAPDFGPHETCSSNVQPGKYNFSCGPWFEKLFQEVAARRISGLSAPPRLEKRITTYEIYKKYDMGGAVD